MSIPHDYSFKKQEGKKFEMPITPIDYVRKHSETKKMNWSESIAIIVLSSIVSSIISALVAYYILK